MNARAATPAPSRGELLCRVDFLDMVYLAGHLTRQEAERIVRDQSVIGYPADLEALEHLLMYRSPGPYGWRVAASRQDNERRDLQKVTKVILREVNLDRGRRTVISP